MNRKTFKVIRLLLSILMIISLLWSCKKTEIQNKNFPKTSLDIEESIKNAQKIELESSSIVESAVNAAYNNNGVIDPNEIAKKIELINGVRSATPTLSGAGIVIEHDDSTFTNILLVTKDDKRMFKINSKKELIEFNNTKKSENISITPTGQGKALILAPFQDSFKTDLDQISELLTTAGYSVDAYLNSDANLERFRGSFLNNYDIIIISTHGIANTMTWGRTNTSTFLTGEEFNQNNSNALTLEEKMSLTVGSHGSGILYFGISVPWLNLTTNDGNFTNSWIYAGACESALGDDNTSLLKAFLNKGAGGCNGWDVSVLASLDNSVTVAMTKQFTSGLSFRAASNEVRIDPLLQESFINTLLLGQEASVSSFSDIQLQQDPFYLIKPKLPTLTTVAMSSITSATAIGGGTISNDGGAIITEKGICWNTSPNPTIVNSRTKDGTGSGNYSSTLIGLTANTLYYVRAYATNSVGTAYGTNEVSFTTSSIIQNGNLIDVDGNIYNLVTIGTQVWMKQNLKVTKYNDGTAIPNVTDASQWNTLTTGAYCWYGNSSSNKDPYGALYNWYTVGTGKLCPIGWHVPSQTEWNTLLTYLGGTDIAGAKLKETGTSHWKSPNTATNESGFNALPGGARALASTGIVFWDLGDRGSLWSSTQAGPGGTWGGGAWEMGLYSGPEAALVPYTNLVGQSVRCLKNN
jgi:uncharacterized protein (TIGR02145 family)